MRSLLNITDLSLEELDELIKLLYAELQDAVETSHITLLRSRPDNS